MKTTFLDFEQLIADLESKIEELRFVQDDSAVDIAEEIERLEKKSAQLTKDIYSKLTPWQISQVARHPQRPYTLDYLELIFTDFEELHGDRAFADDHAIVGGLARFNGQPVMVIGHQKGRDTKEKILRNFGMPRPEGYRKALRLMKLAEKFGLPVMTFVDTPGAYPGIDAEERGQSEAIGRNLYVMAELKVPVIVTIIGEGGSGGALAIAVGDVVQMLQYSTYSVISPEGCASILWKSAEKAPEAAETMGITAPRLKTLGLIDKIVSEPLGGAHRDHAAMAQSLKKSLQEALKNLSAMPTAELLATRYERLMSYGRFKEQVPQVISRIGSRHFSRPGRRRTSAFASAFRGVVTRSSYCMCLPALALVNACRLCMSIMASRRMPTAGRSSARTIAGALASDSCSNRSTSNRRSGLGLEAAARAARYEVFLRYPGDVLLLGHHRGDQAETLLVQPAARGRGRGGSRHSAGKAAPASAHPAPLARRDT